MHRQDASAAVAQARLVIADKQKEAKENPGLSAELTKLQTRYSSAQADLSKHKQASPPIFRCIFL